MVTYAYGQVSVLCLNWNAHNHNRQPAAVRAGIALAVSIIMVLLMVPLIFLFGGAYILSLVFFALCYCYFIVLFCQFFLSFKPSFSSKTYTPSEHWALGFFFVFPALVLVFILPNLLGSVFSDSKHQLIEIFGGSLSFVVWATLFQFIINLRKNVDIKSNLEKHTTNREVEGDHQESINQRYTALQTSWLPYLLMALSLAAIIVGYTFLDERNHQFISWSWQFSTYMVVIVSLYARGKWIVNKLENGIFPKMPFLYWFCIPLIPFIGVALCLVLVVAALYKIPFLFFQYW
jgi:hypothetical protein